VEICMLGAVSCSSTVPVRYSTNWTAVMAGPQGVGWWRSACPGAGWVTRTWCASWGSARKARSASLVYEFLPATPWTPDLSLRSHPGSPSWTGYTASRSPPAPPVAVSRTGTEEISPHRQGPQGTPPPCCRCAQGQACLDSRAHLYEETSSRELRQAQHSTVQYQ